MRGPCALCLMFLALAACAGAPAPTLSTPSEPAMSAPATPTTALPEVRFDGPFDTDLLVAFDVPEGRLVADVRYVLRNTGRGPVIVFDRGTAHDVSTGRQAAGAVGLPRVEASGDDLTLVHAAQPLPDPSPTSPPTPLGLELAPGASLAGRFQTMLPGSALPKRLRWCVAVMTMDEALLHSPQTTQDGRVWTVSFAAVERQERACTPWYDLAQRAFET